MIRAPAEGRVAPMRAQRPGDAGKRIALVAPAGIACQVGGAIGDGVVTSLRDASPFSTPCEQLLAHVAQLGAQVAGRAARTAGRAGSAFAVLVQMVANGQQHALGVARDLGSAHADIVARNVSRQTRSS